MKNTKSMIKKALIVTPYLAHLGGGERYMLEAASVIENLGYQLYFAWDNLEQITKLTSLLNISLDNPQLDKSVLSHYFSHNPLAMYRATRPYDLVLYLSDGSIPLLGARKNIIHIQVPFYSVGGKKLTTQLKLKKIDHLIVNSQFTKGVIDQEFGTHSTVVYPPINSIKAGRKGKLILSVGRFEPSLNVKHQDVLIRAFAKLSSQLPEWRLALAGASADDEYLGELRELSKGLPVDIHPNLSYQDLTKLYGQATIYWHAAGYGVDQKVSPELTEHFGITTAEAISAGCIPLVVGKGGQIEVVPSPALHWSTESELISLTKEVVDNPAKYRELAKELSVDLYNSSQFDQRIEELLK